MYNVHYRFFKMVMDPVLVWLARRFPIQQQTLWSGWLYTTACFHHSLSFIHYLSGNVVYVFVTKLFDKIYRVLSKS